MRRYLYFIAGCVIFMNVAAFGQLVSDNAFLQGRYLEAAIAPNGSWGNTITVPAGYHTHPGGGGTGYTDPVTGTSYTGNGMDFSYDANHDGWAAGNPTGTPCCYYGPYFMPGTPFDGWSIQVNGARSDAFFTNYGFWNATPASNTLTGTVNSYTYTPGCTGITQSFKTGVWNGTAGPGGGLKVVQTNRLDTLASWVVVNTVFTNTTATAMTGLYYWVTGDPDNDEVATGGSFPTNNRIAYQNDAIHRVMAWGRPPSLHQDAFSSLSTKDCRAKALIYTNWASYPAEAVGNTLAQVYAGTATAWLGTCWYGLGNMSLDQDIAYGLIFNIGNLAPGASTFVTYAWGLSDSTAVDSAFQQPQMNVNCFLAPNSYTISPCPQTSIPVRIEHGYWGTTTWNWSPAIGLSSTTGTYNTINVLALPGTTTYTITPSDTSACDHFPPFFLTVITCFTATNNGPICLGDTLKLAAHGDSTGATYVWFGPGAGGPIVGSGQFLNIYPSTWGDTGTFYVVKTVGGAHDTTNTHVSIKALPVVTATSNAVICSGATLNLFSTPDSTGETFAWTGPGGFSSTLQNPTVTGASVGDSGIYHIYTTWNGCRDSSTVHVAIDSTPALPIVGSNSAICSGNTLLLNSGDATPGVTYSWTGPGGFTSTLQNPSIPGATVGASGTYTVTATLAICSTSNSTVATVNPTPPVPVLGNNGPICSGGALNLTATTTAGSTYNWTGPNSFTSVLQNPSISPATTLATGTYSVIATLGVCQSGMATEYAVVDSTPAVPTAGSNSPVCSGNTVMLTSTESTTGVTFSWAGPLGFGSALPNPTITSATTGASGTYTLTVTLGGTCSVTATTLVVVNQTPSAPVLGSNSIICSGNTLNLTAISNAGSTYSWTGPNGFVSALQNPSISPATTLATGNYSVIATLAGCVSPRTVISVIVDSTPATPTAGSNSPVCSGNTLLLNGTDATAGVNYSWAGPGGFTSTLQNPVLTPATTSESGTYTLTVTRGICSNSTVTVVVVNQTPPAPSLSSNSPVCSGSSLNFTATSTVGSTFSWTGPNSFTSFLQNPTINPASTLATGTYSVIATLNGCPSAVSTIYAEVDSTPATPSASSNSPGVPSICRGDTLTFFGYDPTAGVSYSWTGPGSFTSTIDSPIMYNADTTANGQYTLTVTLGGCSVTSIITISVTATPWLFATSNIPCTGVLDTLFLHAYSNAGAAYSWAGPYVFINGAQNPWRNNVIPEFAGVYDVTSILNGCRTIVHDTVIIHQTPPAPWVTWRTYCLGYPAAPLQPAGDSIRWYPTDTGGLATMTIPTPSTADTGITWYFLTQTIGGCQSPIDSIKVTVDPKPTLTLSPDTSICPHDTALLRVINITNPTLSYSWSPSMYLNDTTGTSVTSRAETNINYTVIASNQYGCADTAVVAVTVYPAAIITLGDSVRLYLGETYQISAATNCSVFTWFPPAGLNYPFISNPIASPEVNTKYIVIGQTEWGCTTTDSISIYVNTESLLDAPNAFTPGVAPNNLFKILIRGEATLSYFRIWDRWGVKVFETTDITKGWDGTYNGTPQLFGVYIYEIGAVTNTGRSFTKHGNLTLIR